MDISKRIKEALERKDNISRDFGKRVFSRQVTTEEAYMQGHQEGYRKAVEEIAQKIEKQESEK